MRIIIYPSQTCFLIDQEHDMWREINLNNSCAGINACDQSMRGE